MAAEALETAAREAGHEISVETQGAAGAKPLSPADIAAADVAIFAADVEVRDRHRFSKLPIVQVPVKRAINGAAELIREAEARASVATSVGSPAGNGRAGTPGADLAPALTTKVDAQAGFGTRLRQWLMTGVSYMIPFVAAGGILIALSFVIGGAEVASKVNGGTFHGVKYAGVTDISKLLTQTGYAGVLFKIGATSFSMLVPILAGFIAYAMADRPGIVPGVVAGLLASATGAGFLGGLIGGLLAGAAVMLIMKVRVPKAMLGIMPVLVIPLVSTLVVGFLMIVAIGQPISSATHHLTSWLNGLNGSNALLLGALLGLMMAFDMGGPVNKVAYAFGLASLASGNEKVMAAVMAAGMTPPIALALATVVRPKLFTRAERQAGEAAWLLGASFITEGAIPFAAADPLRVIPSIMAGSAVTGAISLGLGATSPAPHGGIWVSGLLGKPGVWLLAIVSGVLVSAASVMVAKSIGRKVEADAVVSADVTATSRPAATVPVAARTVVSS
jgi:PTS system fructose-specific IIC component